MFVKVLATLGLLDIIYKAAKMMIMHNKNCSEAEAKEMIRKGIKTIINSLLGRQKDNFSIQLMNNGHFNSKVTLDVRNIIGEQKYSSLMTICCGGDPNISLVGYSKHGLLPCIIVPVIYDDNNQKSQLKGVIIRSLKEQLAVAGLPTHTLTQEGVYPNGVHYIEVVYATNKEEGVIMKGLCRENAKRIMSSYTPPVDDTGDDDLNE